MFFNATKHPETAIMAERLPATLLSGIVVGAAARGFRVGYLLTHILVFAVGAFIGWLLGT